MFGREGDSRGAANDDEEGSGRARQMSTPISSKERSSSAGPQESRQRRRSSGHTREEPSRGILPASWQRGLASFWQSRRRSKTAEGEDAADNDSAIEDAESDTARETEDGRKRAAGRRMRRDRSSSLPSVLTSQDETGGGVNERLDDAAEQNAFVPPAALVRMHSTTHSLPLLKGDAKIEARGYAWRNDGTGKSGFVSPSHRNPTGLQAFYDTHFGSSSGYRTIRRPFAGAASRFNEFNPLSKKKDKTEAEEAAIDKLSSESRLLENGASGDKPQTEGNKTLAALMAYLPTAPSIFTMGSPASETAKKAPSDPRAYEPELIPTTHKDPLSNYYFKRLQGNVLVLGGYRGSVLRDAATHQMLWVPLKVGVGLRRPTLELGLTEDDEENSEELVVADEMLSEVGSMVDSGKRLMQRCSSKRTSVSSFGYDWRLSLGRISERLERLLYRLWEESAEDPAQRTGTKVIAHSMGGLVALHALGRSRNPRIFDSLVFASTPFLGTPNILGPLRIGDTALFNEEICSPRATFTFRSTFYLLPNDASQSEGSDTAAGRCFEEEDGMPHDVDFLSVQTWDRLGISPMVEHGTRPKQSGSNGSQDVQKAAKHFSRSQEKATSASNPDMADNFPAVPGAGMQMTTSQTLDADAVRDGVKGAVKAGQALAQDQNDTEATLLPGNQQRDERPSRSSEADEEQTMQKRWAYLERTLAEVQQFVKEMRTSFDEGRFERGEYPPMAILTSGRTPTVRGALTWPYEGKDNSEDPAKAADHWMETARAGDYSRMLYAPGDGVILRRSSVAMPGQWGRCLVRGKSSSTAQQRKAAAAVRALSRQKKYDDVDALDLELTSDEGTVETSHRHVTLLSDVDGIGRCLEACRRARNHREQH